MNISEKSIIETLDYLVSACRRALDEQQDLFYDDQFSICTAYIERLHGIRFIFAEFPKALISVNNAIHQIETFRNQLADVGRSPTQSAVAVE